jgi:hypothetical protein
MWLIGHHQCNLRINIFNPSKTGFADFFSEIFDNFSRSYSKILQINIALLLVNTEGKSP